MMTKEEVASIVKYCNDNKQQKMNYICKTKETKDE